MGQYMQHRTKETNIAPHELAAMRNTELSSDTKPSDKMRKFTLCLMVKNYWRDKEATMHPYPDMTNKNAFLSSVLISYNKKNFPSFVSI